MTLPPTYDDTGTPVVGRSAELAALVRAVVDGHRLVVIDGEAGVGKTRLVRALLRRPEIAGRAVHDGHSLAAGPATGLVILDDLHRAGAATLDAVRSLAVTPRAGTTVVVVSRGDDSLSLLESYRGHLVTHLALAPLGVRDVAELLATTCDWPVPASIAAEVHRRTAGLPLEVEELCRALGRRTPTVDRLDKVGVPAKVRDSVLGRLSDLGQSATAICRAMAVLGCPAGEADIAIVSGLSTRTVAASLVGALNAGLLREAGIGRYDLRHPLAARAVYEAITGPRRRELHLRAAGRLLASGATPDALAYHYRRADELSLWVDATLASVDLGDPAAAVRILESALDDSELPVTAKEGLALRLSREMLRGIAIPATIDRIRTVVRDWPLAKDVRGEIRMNLGQVLVTQAGKVVAGQQEIERALTDLSRRRTVMARGLATLALPAVGNVPLTTNLRWLAKAEQACAGSTDTEAIAAMQASRIAVQMQMADPAAWRVIDALPQAPEAASVRRQLARAYLNLADAAVWNGHFGPAREHLDLAGVLITDTATPYLSSLATGTELRLLASVGAWDGLAEQANELVSSVGQMGYLAADALLSLGWLETWRSTTSLPLRTFQAAADAAPGHVPIAVNARAGRAGVLVGRDQIVAACAEAEAGIALLRRKGNWVWAAELAPIAVMAFRRAGRASDAAALAAEFRHGIQGRDAPLASAAELVCRALLAQDGSDGAAIELFTEAARRYRALPHPRSSARATELAGLCAAGTGDRDSAVRHLLAAEAEFTALAAITDMVRCRKALRRLDPDRPRRGRRGYGNALSPRESEVARLAANGLTNREIAARLTLSQRTIDNHVSSVMRKLDVTSRNDLAARLCFPP